MKIVIKHWDNQQTPWMVGIKWPDGQITLLRGRFMGSWQDALDDALQLAKEIL